MKINYPLRFRLNLFGHPANGFMAQTWFGLLLKYGLHWSEIPKAAVVSLVVLIHAPLGWMERVVFKSRYGNVKIKAPVFIVGHPRSGTTMLHYLLACDPSFVTPRTYQALLPTSFLLTSWIFRPLLKLFMPSARPMDDMALGPDEPKEEEFALAALSGSFAQAYYFPKAIFPIFRKWVLFQDDMNARKRWQNDLQHFGQKILYASGKNRLLFKSPYNLARIDAIVELFPDARFIHIHRHPKNVYQSNLKLYKKLLPFTALQHVSGDEMEAFLSMSYPVIYDKYYSDVSKLPGNRVFEVSYSDLVRDPEKVLTELYKCLELCSFQEVRAFVQPLLTEMKAYIPGDYTKANEKFSLPEDWLRISRRQGYPAT